MKNSVDFLMECRYKPDITEDVTAPDYNIQIDGLDLEDLRGYLRQSVLHTTTAMNEIMYHCGQQGMAIDAIFCLIKRSSPGRKKPSAATMYGNIIDCLDIPYEVSVRWMQKKRAFAKIMPLLQLHIYEYSCTVTEMMDRAPQILHAAKLNLL